MDGSISRFFCGDGSRGQFAGGYYYFTKLYYILVPVPVKYPPLELRELHTQVFRRDECPHPREIPAHGTGG